MRITREDVAREAGVSASTVSYVLNNSRQLSENTVRRVHEAVERLGYKPDMIARSMVKSSTHQLAVALDSILNPYYSEIVLGFENAAIKNGYFVNVCSGQTTWTAILKLLSVGGSTGCLYWPFLTNTARRKFIPWSIQGSPSSPAVLKILI